MPGGQSTTGKVTEGARSGWLVQLGFQWATGAVCGNWHGVDKVELDSTW
jgi:hypothetical protein